MRNAALDRFENGKVEWLSIKYRLITQRVVESRFSAFKVDCNDEREQAKGGFQFEK